MAVSSVSLLLMWDLISPIMTITSGTMNNFALIMNRVDAATGTEALRTLSTNNFI